MTAMKVVLNTIHDITSLHAFHVWTESVPFGYHRSFFSFIKYCCKHMVSCRLNFSNILSHGSITSTSYSYSYALVGICCERFMTGEYAIEMFHTILTHMSCANTVIFVWCRYMYCTCHCLILVHKNCRLLLTRRCIKEIFKHPQKGVTSVIIH